VQGTLAQFCAQVRVIARHDYLQKVLVLKRVAFGICTEVLDDVRGVCLAGLVHVVASQVFQNAARSDPFVSIAVDPLEHRVRLERLQRSQGLSLALDGALSLRYGQQHPFEKLLVLVEKLCALGK